MLHSATFCKYFVNVSVLFCISYGKQHPAITKEWRAMGGNSDTDHFVAYDSNYT